MQSSGLTPTFGSDAVSSEDDLALSVRHPIARRMTPQSPNEALQPEAPPPPPPKPPSKRRPTLSALSGFMSFLVIIAVAALASLVWIENRLGEPGPLPADKDIFIAPHTDLPDIVEKLDAEGVIDSPLIFNIVLVVERKRSKVRAGEYLFKQHVSLRAVIDTLVSGKQIQQAITIPEGLTSTQIVQRLRDDPVLVGEIREIPKDGTLMPDTYKFVRGSSRGDVVGKMEALDKRAVEQIWARRSADLPLRSPYELVTLASIVEKETGKADERPHVAGVFINRLQRHMRLQSDPTIVYGLVGGQGTLGHSITRAELDKKTAYNTYQIDGLPPGPIDNPGRAALEAVANPSRTQDLYFVADGTGGHAFAASIEDHNRNVQRWRQIERDAKDKVDVDKLAPSATVPPPRSNQRSDANDDVFGALPSGVVPVSYGSVAAFSDPAVSHNISKVSAADDNPPAADGRHRRTSKPVDLTTNAFTASLDTLGFSVDGGGLKGSALLDGPVAADTPPAPAGPSPSTGAPAPASPQQAGPVQKASLDAAPAGKVDLFADPNPQDAAPAPQKTPPLHPKIYDASEGTPLDPLKEKDYDLNSGKTIPADLVHQ
jgi:UPF0755 protein